MQRCSSLQLRWHISSMIGTAAPLPHNLCRRAPSCHRPPADHIDWPDRPFGTVRAGATAALEMMGRPTDRHPVGALLGNGGNATPVCRADFNACRRAWTRAGARNAAVLPDCRPSDASPLTAKTVSTPQRSNTMILTAGRPAGTNELRNSLHTTSGPPRTHPPLPDGNPCARAELGELPGRRLPAAAANPRHDRRIDDAGRSSTASPQWLNHLGRAQRCRARTRRTTRDPSARSHIRALRTLAAFTGARRIATASVGASNSRVP